MRKRLWKKGKDKGGFTLVELIVVLVILAILAALLIPALTGYIEKAKQKQIVAETRQVVMAAQTLLDEKYAQGENASGQFGVSAVEKESNPFLNAVDKVLGLEVVYAEGEESNNSVGITVEDVATLAEVDASHIEEIWAENGKVVFVGCQNGDMYCTYTINDDTNVGEYDAKKGTCPTYESLKSKSAGEEN